MSKIVTRNGKVYRIVTPFSAAEDTPEDTAQEPEQTPAPEDQPEALDKLLDGFDEHGLPKPNAAPKPNTPSEDNKPPEDKPEQQKPTPPTPEQKQQYAFGQMRNQITQLEKMLGQVAKASGIEFTDTKDLLNKINDDSLSKLAARSNVSVDLLREMEALRQDSQQWKQQQLKDAASVGFQSLINKYGLSEQELQAFALELDSNGINPFVNAVDLEAEYKVRHFDEITKRMVDKAVQDALKKSGEVDEHSSTPMQKQGGGTDTDKITTVDGLSAFLSDK